MPLVRSRDDHVKAVGAEIDGGEQLGRFAGTSPRCVA
jgi:hypothetical protein